MSFFAGLTSKVGSMLAQPMVQSIGAGLLTGAIVGSVLVASGAIPLEPAPVASSNVTLLACPGFGPAVAEVPSGQTMLVTARSEDGNWLEVYVGTPAVDRAWAPASALQLQAAVTGLPVGGCESSVTAPPLPTDEPTASPEPSVVATVLPTVEPTPSPGASPTPSPKPTPTAKPTPTPIPTPTKTPTPTPTKTPTPTPTKTPTPTPVITPPPPNNAPSIFNLSRNNPCIDNGPTSTQSIVSVFASDPDVGDTLTVRLRLGRIFQGNQYYRLGSFTMTPVGGGQYTYTILASDLQAYGWNSAVSDSEVTFDVTARDNHGVDSPTLKSHDVFDAQVFYQSATGCFIG
jgi:hypothetical protein